MANFAETLEDARSPKPSDALTCRQESVNLMSMIGGAMVGPGARLSGARFFAHQRCGREPLVNDAGSLTEPVPLGAHGTTGTGA
jgi:hypothetical protein